MEKKAKHTQGPWYWADERGDLYNGWHDSCDARIGIDGSPYALRGTSGSEILLYQEWCDEHLDGSKTHYRIITVRKPDADLIAAAPELLQVLTAICEFWDEADTEGLATTLSPDALIGGHDDECTSITIHDLARAAIAKAKGGAS